MRTEFLCISVLRVASGPRVKLASCKSVLTSPLPPHPGSLIRPTVLRPWLFLLFVALCSLLLPALLTVFLLFFLLLLFFFLFVCFFLNKCVVMPAL